MASYAYPKEKLVSKKKQTLISSSSVNIIAIASASWLYMSSLTQIRPVAVGLMFHYHWASFRKPDKKF